MERIDAADLRRLTEASKAVLGTVARDGARYLAERHVRKTKERRQERQGPKGRAVPGRAAASTPPAPARPRRRFRRRWIVVPTLLMLLASALVVLGGLWLLAVLFGMA